MKVTRKHGHVVLGIVVGAFLAWFASRNVHWDRVGSILESTDFKWFFISIVILAVHYALKARRWQILLNHQADVPFSTAFRAMAVGFLMNNLVPARLGELSARPYLLMANSRGVTFSTALATVFAAKVLDLMIVGLLLLFSAAAYTLPDDWLGPAMWLVGLAAFIGVAVGIAAFRLTSGGFEHGLAAVLSRFIGSGAGERVAAQLARFSEGFAALGDGPTFFRALAVSASSFVLMWAAVACSAQALGLTLGVADGILVLALMGIGFTLPAPPTYAGNIHYFVTRAVVLAGIGGEDLGFSLGILIHAVEVIVMSCQGLLSLPGLKWKAGAQAD